MATSPIVAQKAGRGCESTANEKETSGHQPQDDCLSDLLRPLKRRAGPDTAHGADVDSRDHADDPEQRYTAKTHVDHSHMVRRRFWSPRTVVARFFL
jgi:hypothetical protein